jgi:hypothetical protein
VHLNEVTSLLARCGGFLGRQADVETGVKPIWLGLQQITDFTADITDAHARHEP